MKGNLLFCFLLNILFHALPTSASSTVRALTTALNLRKFATRSTSIIYRSNSNKSGSESEESASTAQILAALSVMTGMVSVASVETKLDGSVSGDNHLNVSYKGNVKRVPSMEKALKTNAHLMSKNVDIPLMPDIMFIMSNFTPVCKSERQLDLEEIEQLKKFDGLNFEDPLNLRLMNEVVEGSAAMLLAIRHGLFLKAYGLICKGYCPRVLFSNGDILDASDFIAEIVKTSTEKVDNWEAEQFLILDLILNIHRVADSKPENLLKGQTLAFAMNNFFLYQHLLNLNSFVSRLYLAQFSSSSSSSSTSSSSSSSSSSLS